MDSSHVKQLLESLLEELSAIEHARWAHWQRYMHGKGLKQEDGSLVLPKALVERWERQMSASYAELSEREKESDREQVRKYLPLIARALTVPSLTRDGGT
jgi:hypothetical protein